MSVFLPVLFALSVNAQNVGVKVDGVDARGDGDTTITVSKGKTSPGDAKFEITQGTDELAGDPAPLQKDARANWKKTCDEWKKELRDLNRENQILTMSCGSPSCTTSAMETLCKSTSTHKLKVRIN